MDARADWLLNENVKGNIGSVHIYMRKNNIFFMAKLILIFGFASNISQKCNNIFPNVNHKDCPMVNSLDV